MYRYEIFIGNDGQYYWEYRAPNNQIVAIGGEGYKSEAGALHSIGLVKGSKDAPVYRKNYK